MAPAMTPVFRSKSCLAMAVMNTTVIAEIMHCAATGFTQSAGSYGDIVRTFDKTRKIGYDGPEIINGSSMVNLSCTAVDAAAEALPVRVSRQSFAKLAGRVLRSKIALAAFIYPTASKPAYALT